MILSSHIEDFLKPEPEDLMISCVVPNSCKKSSQMPSIYCKAKKKLMKKLRRHIDSRSSEESVDVTTNNLPPITFHPTHGNNIRLQSDGAIARRADGFCDGVVFSNRPIRINEKIYIKISETSTNWSGVLRLGFSSVNPTALKECLPKFAIPDMTNKPGYWAKALADRRAQQDVVLFYYVTAKGDVHFGVNGKEKGVLFSGVNTRGPLWALLDIYGNTTAVEILGTYNSLGSFTQSNLQRLKVVHNKLNVD